MGVGWAWRTSVRHSGANSRQGRRGPRWGAQATLAWSGVLALAGFLALHERPAIAPAVVAVRPVPVVVAARPVPLVAATAAEVKTVANPYGGLIADGLINPYGDLVAIAPERAPAAPLASSSLQASVAFAPPDPAAIPLIEKSPAPPQRDDVAVEQTAPLPPLRPAEFASLAPGAPVERRPPPVVANRIAHPTAAPPDGRNIFEKLFGVGQPPASASAGRLCGAR